MRFKGLGLGFGFVLLSAVGLVAQHAPYYVLDGYGGIHVGGGAPAVSPGTPYFGWNIARDLVYIPIAQNDTNHGDGLLVLDGFGGVHKGGKLSTISIAPSPYFGWDIAKAIEFRRIDPQAYGTASTGWVDYTDSDIHTLAGPINMVLPDAGYVLVTGNVWVINTSLTAGESISGLVGIGLNSETSMDTASTKGCTIQAEQIVSGKYNNTTVAVSRLFYFSTSGTQRFYLLVRKDGGTGTYRAAYPCFNAVYFNKRWDAVSMSLQDEDLTLAPDTLSQAESPTKIK